MKKIFLPLFLHLIVLTSVHAVVTAGFHQFQESEKKSSDYSTLNQERRREADQTTPNSSDLSSLTPRGSDLPREEFDEVQTMIESFDDADEKKRQLEAAIDSFIKLRDELLTMRRTMALLESLDFSRYPPSPECESLWVQNPINFIVNQKKRARYLVPNTTSCPLLTHNKEDSLATVVPPMILSNIKIIIPAGIGINKTEKPKTYYPPKIKDVKLTDSQTKEKIKNDLQKALESLYAENPESLSAIRTSFENFKDWIEVDKMINVITNLNPSLQDQVTHYKNRFNKEFGISIEEIDSAATLLESVKQEIQERQFFYPEKLDSNVEENKVNNIESPLKTTEPISNETEIEEDTDAKMLKQLKAILDDVNRRDARTLFSCARYSKRQEVIENIIEYHEKYNAKFPSIFPGFPSWPNQTKEVFQKAKQFPEREKALAQKTATFFNSVLNPRPLLNKEDTNNPEIIPFENKTSAFNENIITITSKIQQAFSDYLTSTQQVYQLVIKQINKEREEKRKLQLEADKKIEALNTRMFIKRPY